MKDLQEEATKIMRADVGEWNCRWEFLDENGNITSTANGTQSNQFVIDDRVLQMTIEVPDLKIKSVGQKFLSSIEKRFLFVSVDNKGDLWTFVEPVGVENSKSKPHKNADGSISFLRFTTIRKTESEVDVLMELSSDEETWAKIFRQYRVRAPLHKHPDKLPKP